jgi:predicted ATPase/class 3 adenylate cyclase
MPFALPTGTVTFLFTDIEGSTRLLLELKDRYARAQNEHETIIRGAVDSAGGVVVRIEGDSLFAAFRSPLAAVQAAADAQRGLATHKWSHGGPLLVRMGLHTGEGTLGGGDYVGIDVNLAARIAAAGSGGQVLLSEATRALVEHALPEGTAIRDLGQHHLKDIVHSEHLYDLVIEGLRADFPPPRTLGAGPINFPTELTSFVGRKKALAELTSLLGRTRLLTLTGPGGTGKTRLATHLAAKTAAGYTDGAYFVDLSAVTDPVLVPSALAGAMAIAERRDRPVLEILKGDVADKHLLLIIDNFEQVVEAGPVIEELLAVAPNLTVVVTSRIALNLRGEQAYVVPPLDLPDLGRLPDLATLSQLEAIRLFTDRAREVAPGFRLTEENASAVAEITTRLDGLPLAIELATRRTRVLSPMELASRLTERLAVLTSGMRSLPDRQRTLRGAIAWSHDLLQQAEQRLFASVSVFAGGWMLAAAEAVCRPDELGIDLLETMTALVEHSLVRRIEITSGESRFSMLETIREFARDELKARGNEQAVLRRHAEYFLGLALEAEPHLEIDPRWLDRCDREHDNLRAALRWAIDSGDTNRTQQAAGALWRFWQLRGHLSEGRRWLEESLRMASGDRPTAARAKALAGVGGIYWWQGDVPGARTAYEEALDIERRLGDPDRTAEALYNMAFPLVADGDMDAAAKLLEESLDLFRGRDNESGVARALEMLSWRDALAGQWAPSISRIEDALAIWRKLGDLFHLVDDLVSLALVYSRVDRPTEARAAALEALDLSLDSATPLGIGGALWALAVQANIDRRYADALRLLATVKSLSDQAGGAPPIAAVVFFFGDPESEARAHLSEQEAARAWKDGTAMTVDEAVSVARGHPAKPD